ncbi:DUF3991 domain-containing protein [Brevibacillus humidisoli]|uniref:DUF3991 domain-containing protein n=1 Tax=Brevibacillus humidisoli TaxID=2895522 RepID=UPI001E3B4BD2|nr:DUF3991 domain-containing protein [Brevibacillus humidisoli]UFJ41356.1 DUF3991 domain-containing protein [Brevibacillus humidisoli]
MERDVILQARQTDLPSFLCSMGFDLKKEGKNYRLTSYSGVLVRDNMYTDFANGKSGNAVDFCMQVLHLPFHEAVEALNKYGARVQLPESLSKEAKQEQPVVLPERAENYRRIFAYLHRTRGIPVSLIQELIREKLLYQDCKGNAVFICRDESGEARGAMIRGTLTGKSFKQRIGSGEFPFIWGAAVGKTTLTLTEAPIEALSIATLYPESRQSILVSLGGIDFISSVEKLLEQYLIKRLVLSFNNDRPGREAVQRFTERFGHQVEVKAFLPSAEDWNEHLLTHKSGTQCLER